MQITVSASGRDLISEKITAKADGSFEYRFEVEACCDYTVTAENADKKATDEFKTDVPKKLRKGPITALYNQSLQAQGFHTGTKGAPRHERHAPRDQGLPQGQRHAPQRALPALDLPHAAAGPRRASTSATRAAAATSRSTSRSRRCR